MCPGVSTNSDRFSADSVSMFHGDVAVRFLFPLLVKYISGRIGCES